MVLSDKSIVAEMHKGNIIIGDYQPKHQNPNSVDLTLNPVCKVYKDEVLDCRKPNETLEFTIPEEGMVLQPNRIYLYHCNEIIGVKGNLCARVEGKSSLARLGLFIHVTAGWIDSGFTGSLVLELHCVQPVHIYPNQKICQVCFLRVEGEIEESYDKKEGSKYMNQTGVQESLMHKNFETKNNG